MDYDQKTNEINDGLGDSGESDGEEGEEEMEQQLEDEDSDEIDDGTHCSQPKKVRQNLANLRIFQKYENEPIVFSYHYKYEKYLRENNLIDVSY